MVVVASVAQHITGSNHNSGILIFLPVTKKMVTFVSKGGEDMLRTLHWTQLVSKFSHLAWEISCVNNKKYGTVM
jgi:hypothetical protein